MTTPTDTAIVLRQPTATLVLLGAQTIITRPTAPNGPMRQGRNRGRLGRAIQPGQRIWIVAGDLIPEDQARLTDDFTYDEWVGPGFIGGHKNVLPCTDDGGWSMVTMQTDAVVGSVVVDEVLPIVNPDDCPDRPHLILSYAETKLDYCDGAEDVTWGADHSDQLPFSDFTPGRWAWILSSPEWCPEPELAPCGSRRRKMAFGLPESLGLRLVNQ